MRLKLVASIMTATDTFRVILACVLADGAAALHAACAEARASQPLMLLEGALLAPQEPELDTALREAAATNDAARALAALACVCRDSRGACALALQQLMPAPPRDHQRALRGVMRMLTRLAWNGVALDAESGAAVAAGLRMLTPPLTTLRPEPSPLMLEAEHVIRMVIGNDLGEAETGEAIVCMCHARTTAWHMHVLLATLHAGLIAGRGQRIEDDPNVYEVLIQWTPDSEPESVSVPTVQGLVEHLMEHAANTGQG